MLTIIRARARARAREYVRVTLSSLLSPSVLVFHLARAPRATRVTSRNRLFLHNFPRPAEARREARARGRRGRAEATAPSVSSESS